MKMRKLKMLNVDEDVLKLPKANFSLHEMKLLCKKHGISNSSEYKKRYKEPESVRPAPRNASNLLNCMAI